MKEEKKKATLTQILTAAIGIPAIGTALYIMFHGLGLSDSLDFGAGAYYYADIPLFQQYVNGDSFTSATPMWALTALFLLWGFVMYRFWVWLERRTEAAGEKGRP